MKGNDPLEDIRGFIKWGRENPWRPRPPVVTLPWSEYKRLRRAGMIDKYGRFMPGRNGEDG